jgi:integrase
MLILAPQIAYTGPLVIEEGGVLAMLAKKSVWLRWKSGKGRWEVGMYWEGRAKRFYTWNTPQGYVQFTRENKIWAEALKRYIEARLIPNEDGIIAFHPDQVRTGIKKASHIFCNYVKGWLKEYEELAKRGKRSREYVQHLHRYNRLYWTSQLGNLHLREINKVVLRDFWLWLCDQGKGDNYIKKVMDGLKKLLSDFYEDEPDKVPRFPDYASGIKTREHKTLTEKEQDYVLDFVPAIHRPIVRLFFYHGCRMSEARFLKRKDVDLKQGRAIMRTLKGGPERVIWLEPQVIEDMQEIPPALHGFMFHHDGKPYSKTTLWKIIRHALNDAGFHDVTPNYAGRHSFAAIRSAKGQPSLDLQYEMGHSDIRTTQRYYHRGNQERQRKWSRGEG